MVAPPSSLQPPILADVTIDNLMKHTFDADQQTWSDHGVPAKSDAIEDIEQSGSEESASEPSAAPSETPANKIGEPAIEDEWSPASDEAQSATSAALPETSAVDVEAVPALEDLWLSAGNDEVEDGHAAIVDTQAVEIEEEWSSESSPANNEEESPTQQTTQPMVNSQFMVSQSRITLPKSNSPFPLTDAWPVE